MSKGDIFQPTFNKESEQDFNWDNFVWDVQGNNRFDEAVGRYFGEGPNDFVVTKVVVGKWGDLKITFTKG